MRLHHMAMRTRGMEELERFYVDVVGLTVIARPREGSVWLGADGVVIMIEQAEESEPAVPAGGLDLVAFAVTEEELASRCIALERAGVALDGRTARTLYLRDPDGRRVGLSAYVFDPPPS